MNSYPYLDIYDYVTQQETAYAMPITVMEGWDWGMKEHIKQSVFYKYGRLLGGNDENTPVKNITRPILNLAYRAEDIDVKDITIYVNDADRYHMSFLVKKYHDEVFVKEHNLDSFFDETKVEKIDFGGALVRKLSGARPEHVPLQSLAFCDQTDILNGPFAIKHFYSPDQLKEFESKGWGNEVNGATSTLDYVIEKADEEKALANKEGNASKTPGKYIEVYEVYGTLPDYFLNGGSPAEGGKKYSRQMHIITFYQTQNGQRQGITLFKKKIRTLPFKFVKRENIYGRGLGYGGVEELFEAQIWTNYSVIQKKEMLDAASKVILKTTDAAFAQRNNVSRMENLQVAVLQEGKDIGQIDTFPRNYRLFEGAVQEWEAHAQRTGSATDPLLGEEPSSGTPFKLQDLLVTQGQSIHEYRQGQYAKFIEEIYKDWIIPHIAEQVTNGVKFLSTLTQDEMEYVADCVVRVEAKKYVVEKILSGEIVYEEEVEAYKERVRQEFSQGGTQKFLEILKDEMKDAPLRVHLNVSGKQKNLAVIVDKLTNIFRQVFANPAILDDPRAAKIFNKIIEYSGLDPVDFGSTKYYERKQEPQELPQQTNRLPKPVAA